MKNRIVNSLALGVLLAAGATQAAGPLYLTEGTNPQPLRWDTSNGPIPVYTDGGTAYSFMEDGTTPFVSIERANEVTAWAFAQWSNVETSTFQAEVSGTIESQTGIADVTAANADEIYFVENGYGFWVLYDSDGSILEDYFGVPKDAVLGIAFPEFADGDNNIIEATAVMNGYFVWADDENIERQAGVFTHEFGHAINMAHSQTNGQLAYYSYPFPGSELYPGVPGCGVDPVVRADYAQYGLPTADPADIETMYPFIDTRSVAGVEQSTVEHPDDVASISFLYPTEDYLATRGSISGVLRLKDGKTEYSGINVIARNVNDPLKDAVSGMAGMLTQGQVGPDGRYVINNLTPGEPYVVYIEEIVAGGFSTPATMLLSQAEYWNAAEGSDPLVDNACDVTPIVAEAGVTKQADITLNGFRKGVQITPIVNAYLRALAKNGRSAAGSIDNIAFKWDENAGLTVLPTEFKAAWGAMSANGQEMLVSADLDGNGISNGIVWNQRHITEIEDLNGDRCGVSGASGELAISPLAIDASGKTVVGYATVDTDGDGSCQRSYMDEVMPMIWTKRGGTRLLDTSAVGERSQPWMRAHAISGDGRIVLGTANNRRAFAWIDEGPMIDLTAEFGAKAAYGVNYDGSAVALETAEGTLLWNAHTGATELLPGLRWCYDQPYYDWFGGNLCDVYDWDFLNEALGPIPVAILDMNDDGSVMLGRSGDFFTGYTGLIWVRDLGWLPIDDFLREQGVVEASNLSFAGIESITAKGSKIAGIAGGLLSWIIDLDQVYVCRDGISELTGFPNGVRGMIASGAQLGRCEFTD